jgi:hypothetical protein
MPTKTEPTEPGKTTLVDFAGGSNAIYVGEAKYCQPTFTLPVTAVSKAGDASIAAVAHGLAVGNAVQFVGGVGSWAALNGPQIVKAVTDADNFTIEPDTSGYSGTFAGTVTTTAARTSAACWRITQNWYDGANNVVRISSASGAAENNIWDNRATLAYQ